MVARVVDPDTWPQSKIKGAFTGLSIAAAILFGLWVLIVNWQEISMIVGGLIIIAFEWLWSLPGYVWFGLLLLFGIAAIVSRLEALNVQMYHLIQEVRALRPKQDENSEDFDDLDDEEF